MNRTQSKILFSDLDGTLLDNQKEITKRNILSIKKALELGHKFVITSGRPVFSAVTFSKSLNLMKEGCYTVSYNGGLVYDNFHNTILHEIPLDMKYVEILFTESKKYHLHCHTYEDSRVVAAGESEALSFYQKQVNVDSVIVSDVVSYLKKPPIKVCVSDLREHKKLLAFRQHINSLAGNHLTSVFSSDILLEFNAPNASKGNAVTFLCNYLNIPIENSIAIGDAENDITMIKAAHLGAAMRNGSDAVKEAADYVTVNDNNHDGVSEIIEKFML